MSEIKPKIHIIISMFAFTVILLYLTSFSWQKFDNWFFRIALIAIDIFFIILAYGIEKWLFRPKYSITSVKIEKIVELIEDCGMIEGSHHKQWILDQILQICLEKEGYQIWLEKYNSELDWEKWDRGISP